MAHSTSMISDMRALEEGLYILYQNISSTISFNFDYPVSEEDLRMATKGLMAYLAHYIARNKRRANTPPFAENLEFHVLRTRNLDEDTINDDGTWTKGDKEWYYLVLSESEGGIGSGGDMQIIAEGWLRKEKAELLDGFREMVESQNAKWEMQDEVMDEKRLEKKRLEAEIAKKEIDEMEKKASRKRKAAGKKGKKKKKKIKVQELVDKEDLEDE